MEQFLGVFVVLFLCYQAVLASYFGGKKFRAIKSRIERHTKDCNALNEHIEALKSSYLDVASTDYGVGELRDNSHYNMRRRRWAEETRNRRTHNCSALVVKNASNQPFKYLCKYFNIEIREDSLEKFEEVLNDFSAAEQGMELLHAEREAIVSGVGQDIPFLVRTIHRKRLIRELGFDPVDFSDLYFPVYTFQYISAGGNSSAKCEIRLDIQNLNKFVTFLGNLVKFRNSVRGQRALMTSSLREKIKQRDGYTCRCCNASVAEEKNLLLEIDHILPLARGGMTTVDNLQTLCWRCNRSKGAKVLQYGATG